MVHHLDAHCPLDVDLRMMNCENPRRSARRRLFLQNAVRRKKVRQMQHYNEILLLSVSALCVLNIPDNEAFIGIKI